MTPSITRPLLLALLLALTLPAGALAAEGELRWGLHVTLAAKWLDPAETETLHQMQKARVEESGANPVPGFAYSAPFEDLKLEK